MNKSSSISGTQNSVSGPKLPRSTTIRSLWENGWAVLRAQWYLRRANQVSKTVRLWGRAVVSNQGKLIIGERVRLNSTITPIELAVGAQGRLEIGDNTFINYGVSIGALQLVRIGPNCNIGPYVNIIDNEFHRLEPHRRYELPDSRPVILEENVWLGLRVIVLPGVTIGKDSVVGAGSVVTKDIPPGCIAAGVPAKIIKTL